MTLDSQWRYLEGLSFNQNIEYPFVPQSITKIERVNLIYNSTNLKQEKYNFNSQLINMISAKNPKKDFSKKTKKKMNQKNLSRHFASKSSFLSTFCSTNTVLEIYLDP